MKVIGLTGNIGCGKSAVAAMLRRLGAECVDADLLVHELLAPGTLTTRRVVRRFGREILKPDGGVDRQALARIVFANPKRLLSLERIIHPAVIAEVDRRLQASTAPVFVVEAIKLLESDLSIRCDQAWVVTCAAEQQVARLVGPRGMSREDALQRIRAQPAQAEKAARANVVIDNSGALEDTWRQVEAAWDRLLGPGGQGSQVPPTRS
ncbi:MAG: dephospho-CoA kinase [Chloroflexi bacterium]|nr:dephospho-CoA kinase [Chloroflexota bacterium]